MLKFGSRGPAVAEMHSKLNWIPKPALSEEPDAFFDMETQGQVRHFQARHSLTPDGIVGPETHDALDDWSQYYSNWTIDSASR